MAALSSLLREIVMPAEFRWKTRYSVLTVLFMTWIVSFIDRTAMAVAIPYIAVDFKLTPLAMGGVMSAFFAGYSIAQIPGGILADRFGLRKVSALAIGWWSVFTALTGMVGSLFHMLVVRVIFGLGEGLFPGCSFKGISVWFPQRERSTANAIMLASNYLGPAITPLVVVAIMAAWGWRATFFVLFIPGLIIVSCLWVYLRDRPADNPKLSPEELVEIEGDQRSQAQAAGKKLTIAEALKERTVWQCFLVLFFYDLTVKGFSAWLPSYLVKARGFNMLHMGIAASLPYFAGTLCCVLGGWVSDRFFPKRRRIPIVATQLLSALFLYLTCTTKVIVLVVVYQTLTGACLAFFLSTFWALPMNTIPKSVMGTAGGFINMAGQIAAVVSPLVIGYLVQISKGGFYSAFMFQIGAVLVSVAIVFTLKEQTGEGKRGELSVVSKA
jgi:sugar phosphate permease